MNIIHFLIWYIITLLLWLLSFLNWLHDKTVVIVIVIIVYLDTFASGHVSKDSQLPAGYFYVICYDVSETMHLSSGEFILTIIFLLSPC